MLVASVNVVACGGAMRREQKNNVSTVYRAGRNIPDEASDYVYTYFLAIKAALERASSFAMGPNLG